MQTQAKCKACASPFKKCVHHSTTTTELPKKKDYFSPSGLSNNDLNTQNKKKVNREAAYHTLDESLGSNKTHSFSIYPFHSPTKCRVCNELIIGLGTQGFKCQMCKYGPVHKKCICNVPHRTCTDRNPNGPVSTASFQLKEEVINLKKRIQELETKEEERATSTFTATQHNTTPQINTTALASESCVVCYENKINCVLLECGHRALCMDCGNKLTDCPMCRKPIERIIRVYDAH